MHAPSAARIRERSSARLSRCGLRRGRRSGRLGLVLEKIAGRPRGACRATSRRPRANVLGRHRLDVAGPLRHVRDCAADGQRRTVDPRERRLAVLRVDSVGDQPRLRPRELRLVDALVDELGEDVLEVLSRASKVTPGGARRRSPGASGRRQCPDTNRRRQRRPASPRPAGDAGAGRLRRRGSATSTSRASASPGSAREIGGHQPCALQRRLLDLGVGQAYAPRGAWDRLLRAGRTGASAGARSGRRSSRRHGEPRRPSRRRPRPGSHCSGV